jgi:uncharacterized protein YbjT (DUF2867 family)
VVSVLLTEGHSGVIYDVSGPESLTMRKVAESFSGVTGRNIAYHAETIEEGILIRRRANYGGSGKG